MTVTKTSLDTSVLELPNFGFMSTLIICESRDSIFVDDVIDLNDGLEQQILLTPSIEITLIKATFKTQ